MSSRVWDGAGVLPAVVGERRPVEMTALPAGLPTVDQLFTFMRDAEHRFETLRLRIEERTRTTRGEHLMVTETLLRHPGFAKVVTTVPGSGFNASYEVWVTDGETVRTYDAQRKLGTQRPVRPMVRGVADGADLPGMSRVYVPLTQLPMETLPELFVHPAGYCQNVLATGVCRVTGVTELLGREAIIVESAHPRSVEVEADRPDFQVRVAADRGDGVILWLEESIAGDVTRDARATVYEPNAVLPPTAFDFTFPPDTTLLY